MIPSPNQPPRKHCIRRNTPHQAHYLTFSCYHRRPFLSRDRTHHWVKDTLAHARLKHNFDLWAWVIMPEHMHLLIWPHNEPYSIAKILHAIKLPIARTAIHYLRSHQPAALAKLTHTTSTGTTTHRFWQSGGGYDRNLFSPNKIWEKINYIHHNPVRRGLVQHPTDWQWSSTAYYKNGTPGLLPIDHASIPWKR